MKLKGKIWFVSVLTACLLSFFTGCSARVPALVTVDGAAITQEQLMSVTYSYLLQSVPAETLSDYLSKERFERLEIELLIFMTDIEAEKAHYKQEGVTVVDKQTRTSLKNEAADTLKALRADELTDPDVFGVTEDAVYYFLEASVYDAKFAEDALAENPVTDADAQSYYEAHKSDYETTDGETRAFDEVRTDIRATLETRRVQDAHAALREASTIVWSDALLIDENSNLPIRYQSENDVGAAQ